MFQFIVWLRAIAAVFITNSHYADIWPASWMAFGGQIGNCIFFFVSGFCLFNIKDNFLKWYGKRIIRIYPALWITSTVSFIWGNFRVGNFTALIHCYLYPTWYHFIGSIMALYIVFYIIRLIQKKWNVHMMWFMGITLGIFLIIYCLKFSTSTFHIESIEEKWVRFQFMECMLIGALLREKYETISEKISVWSILNVCVSFSTYVVAKKVIPSREYFYCIQIILPFILLWLIVAVGLLFVKLEKKHLFEKVHKYISNVVSFIAGIALEIYLCQYVVIARNIFLFPLSFIIVTGGIIIYAWIVHKIADFVQKKASAFLYR
ncbi:MAG: acyltransferase family protein [Eubacterium sp.]|nr:acyltransferase family protein [Eubacterium sp.]